MRVNVMSGDTKSSIDIARQALKQLALNQIAPTPDNFKKVYEQISGQVSSKSNEVHLFQLFEKVLREAGETRFEYAQLARDMKYALAHDDWEKVEFQLKRLLRDMTASHADDEVVAKLHDPALLWRDLLVQLLELGLITQIQHIPELEKKAKLLLDKAKSAESIEDIRKLKKSFESYWLKLQQNASASHVLHQELMQLFQLLIENMSHLALDDDWMHGQIDIVKNLIGQPLNIDMVNEVKTNLSALLFRQKLPKRPLKKWPSIVWNCLKM
jgi:diguanylate cyclase